MKAILATALLISTSFASTNSTWDYKSHNRPSLKEFRAGKDIVSKTVSDILDSGFSEIRKNELVHIASKSMMGGNVVISHGTIFVYCHSNSTEIERKILPYFKYKSNHPNVNFGVHNNASLKEFLNGLNTVKTAIKDIEANGFKARFDFYAKIASNGMSGGNVVVENSTFYASHSATQTEIEKKLFQFFTYKSIKEDLAKYFVHGSTISLQSFVKTKQLINETLLNIKNKGFSLYNLPHIGITGSKMAGGHAVSFNGTLYFSNDASASEIEREILRHVHYVGSHEDRIKYQTHNRPDLNEFLYGKKTINLIIDNILEAGFSIIKDRTIHITPEIMSGGHIVKSNGNLYISIKAQTDEIEGFLLENIVKQ